MSDLADAEEEEAQPPTPDATASSSAAGPTVFRLYRYLPEGVGTGCHAHSDLGLLTLSPAPTRPGLLLYDSETLEWHEGEDGMHAERLRSFAESSCPTCRAGSCRRLCTACRAQQQQQ